MNKFIEAIADEANFTSNMKFTENGAVALSSTGNSLLDFYATSGALRQQNETEIINLFKKAYEENPLAAMKALFFTRDIRGGRGERRTFRVILKWLANKAPLNVIINFDEIMELGRADDFYVLVGTKAEFYMWQYLKMQFAKDLQNAKSGKPCSLLAKWLKSNNTSSKESRLLADKTAKAFGLTPREYRKSLAYLRKHLKVVETKMSANEWTSIEYSQVPAIAMNRYRKAFERHDVEGFNKFVKRVESGEEEIKASTLYPYDLTYDYLYNRGHNPFYYNSVKEDPIIEAQWKALPNYVEGEHNVLVMADVSGSMEGKPMATSIGLAIYFAERNHGAFKNYYMAFSSNPTFIKVNPSDSLIKKVDSVLATEIGYSTNLEGAFRKILNTALMNKVPQEDMPKALVVISDMEIDPFFHKDTSKYGYYRNYNLDFVSEMVKRFHAAGYEMPKLVLWNVDARANTFHADATNPYVTFASGSGVAEFKSVLDGINLSAFEAMMETLNQERYKNIKVVVE